jgi:hypothetical protein
MTTQATVASPGTDWQRCDHVDLATVLGHPAQPSLLKAELLLDHPEWMLTLGADVRFGGLDQILQPSIWGVW